MTFCLQFRSMRGKMELYSSDPVKYQSQIEACYAKGQKKFKRLYYYKKLTVVKRSVLRRIGLKK